MSEGGSGKSLFEILITPSVIALVGGIATYMITQEQIDSSERIAAAQRATAERLARVEQEFTRLQFFTKLIASEQELERVIAVQILPTVDPELAAQLLSAIATDAQQSTEVRDQARSLAARAARSGAFPVVGSFRELEEALAFASRLRSRRLPYAPEVYLSENLYYAVTLGGYLDVDEAVRRTEFARSEGIAADAYTYSSKAWGENLLSD